MGSPGTPVTCHIFDKIFYSMFREGIWGKRRGGVVTEKL